MNTSKYIGILFFITLPIFICQPCAAAEPTGQADTTMVSRIVDNFVTASGEWSSKLEGAVKDLFKIFVVLELTVIAIKGLIQKVSLEDLLGHLIMAALMSGVILFFIHNYKDFTHSIMAGLAEYTDLLGYNSRKIVTSPFDKGFQFFKALLARMDGWSPIDSLAYLLAGFAILICFALITVQIIYIKCETLIAVSASFILMGFGAFSMTRDYVMNLLRYVIAVGFKLYILYIVLGLGFAFIEPQLVANAKLSFADLGVTLVTVLIIYVLTKSLPDVASGIINGAHVSTGNALASTLKTVTIGAVAAGIGAVIGGAKAGKSGNEKRKNFGEARKQAKENGGGILEGIRNYRSASREAKNDANPSHNSRVRSKLEAMRERAKNGNQ